MAYDPFTRGASPVGVRTVHTADSARQHRPLTFEVWYPAAETHAGQDVVDPTRDSYDLLPGFPPVTQDAVRDATLLPGTYPFIAFSHGFGGHRRQSTFLCTHLASHGYIVAAVDHTGNTLTDMIQMIMQVQLGGALPEPIQLLGEFVQLRPEDIQFMIDSIFGGGAGDDVASFLAPEQIGMTGHSFGGWTTLAVTARDRRVRAALPLAPGGGSVDALPIEIMRNSLDFNWGRNVPTLFLVAENDSILPLAGMHELLERTQSPKRMVALKNSDHMHFCDRVEEMHELFRLMPPPGDFERIAKGVRPISELCPGEHAYRFVRGLGLAHMDAHLKGNDSAARLLAGDIKATLAERGVAVEVF